MKKINYIDSIRSPIITEKATILSEQNKTVFKVHERANKKTIKSPSKKVIREKTYEAFDDQKDESGWSISDDRKLIALFKRKVPEHALSKIFKKSLKETKERIIYLKNKD